MKIELIHIGGQTMTAQVTGYTETSLFVRFPIDLTAPYEIRVRSNKMIGVQGRWKASDHDRLKEVHRMLSKEREQRLKEKRYA